MITFQDFCRIVNEFGMHVVKGTYDSFIEMPMNSVYYMGRYDMNNLNCIISYNLEYNTSYQDIIPKDVKIVHDVEELREAVKSHLQARKKLKLKLKLDDIEKDFE